MEQDYITLKTDTAITNDVFNNYTFMVLRRVHKIVKQPDKQNYNIWGTLRYSNCKNTIAVWMTHINNIQKVADNQEKFLKK